jgi:hypothetical protein
MSTSPHPQVLKATLVVIAVVQAVLGFGFLLAPKGMAAMLGLSVAPGWADWLFGMMAARCLGYAWLMLMAARQPSSQLHGMRTMVIIQLIDWGVTMKYLWLGEVTLMQVNTAALLPLVFVVLLAWAWPKAPAPHERTMA